MQNSKTIEKVFGIVHIHSKFHKLKKQSVESSKLMNPLGVKTVKLLDPNTVTMLNLCLQQQRVPNIPPKQRGNPTNVTENNKAFTSTSLVLEPLTVHVRLKRGGRHLVPNLDSSELGTK